MPRRPVEDGLRVYLRQISRTPLLTADEERELGWRVINDDDQHARDRLIVCNLRLVVSICADFASTGASLPDLIEEGNLGLIRAVQGFDPARGTRFSTYAAAWIRRSVLRIVTESAPMIRVPAHMRAMIDQWRRTAQRCEREWGRPATTEEIAADMNVSPVQLESLRRAMLALSARSGPATANGDFEPHDPGEAAISTGVEAPETVVARREACDRVIDGIRCLEGRQAQILRLRLGLDGRRPLTFHQIGCEMGMTGEGARKAGKAGLQRLRAMLEPAPRRSATATLG